MAKIAPQVLESLARIGFAEKPLMAWLEERLNEHKEKLMYQMDEAQMRVFQGRAQELDELRSLIKAAPELLRKA